MMLNDADLFSSISSFLVKTDAQQSKQGVETRQTRGLVCAPLSAAIPVSYTTTAVHVLGCLYFFFLNQVTDVMKCF